ncbi:Low affinity immunoglobulin epsilon Fc receptor [Amphibalanus amphitrite]|uniref:Low affinity immunoglobulin epsilon Fc receptor n=1 Tax=Amphibalanus amphitrite TaxID=1232801 RepID=A0A6A4W065_AMPAM|nr:Low affinity immunoglobulin epsilon Fc receptor [Amphibalanus amphitrite]
MIRSALLLSALAAAASAVTCPPDWVQVGYSCYYLSTYTDTWRNSETTCQTLGGHLMSVSSPAEQDVITNYLRASDAWIGLNDLEDDGHYVWTDGTPYQYVHWAPGQPNDLLDQDCVSVLEDGSGQWDDNHCKYTKLFICEKMAS